MHLPISFFPGALPVITGLPLSSGRCYLSHREMYKFNVAPREVSAVSCIEPQSRALPPLHRRVIHFFQLCDWAETLQKLIVWGGKKLRLHPFCPEISLLWKVAAELQKELGFYGLETEEFNPGQWQAWLAQSFVTLIKIYKKKYKNFLTQHQEEDRKLSKYLKDYCCSCKVPDQTNVIICLW